MKTNTSSEKSDGIGCVMVCPLAGVQPEHLSRDMEEIAININEMLDATILKFDHFAAGDYCIDESGHLYNAWFEVLATGEKYPMAVLESEQCLAEGFNLCVKPDWFDGSIRWIGPAHKRQFQEALLAWTDRQFAAKNASAPSASSVPSAAQPELVASGAVEDVITSDLETGSTPLPTGPDTDVLSDSVAN